MERLSEYDLLQLSYHLDTEKWKIVGQYLKIPLSRLDLIYENHKHESYAERAYRMLLLWGEMYPRECTVMHLVKALKSVGLESTSLKVQQVQLSLTSGTSSQIAKGDTGEAIKDWIKISNIEYCTNDPIGMGSYCTVFRGRFNKKTAAVKEIDKTFSKEIETEIKMLNLLRGHHCILKFLGNEERDGFCYLALELCKCNLYDYIKLKKGISEIYSQQMYILPQITEGLAYLHENNIVHRDLKPVHILIMPQSDHTGEIRAVISSFGHCKNVSDRLVSNRTYAEGASGYTAYEILQRPKFRKAADIFSLGCIYYFVISNGEALFHSDFDVRSRPPALQSRDGWLPKTFESSFAHGKEMKTMIPNMIHKDPAERPSCSKILTSTLFLELRQMCSQSKEQRKEVFRRWYSNSSIDIFDDATTRSTSSGKEAVNAILTTCSEAPPIFNFRVERSSRRLSPSRSRGPFPEVEPNILESRDVTDGPIVNSGAAEFNEPERDFVISKITFNFKSVLGVGPRRTVVFKGQFDGREAAIMRLDKNFSNLVDEKVQFLISNSHPNLLPYYGKEENKRFYYLAMEECQGSLTNYILYPETFKGSVIKPNTLLLQITAGLKYLHDNHLTHSNINPYNVLLTHPDRYKIIKTVISDFGIDIKSHTENRKLGFPGFNSLEVVETNTRSKAADIFSLGCVYYYIMSQGSQLFYSDFDVVHRNPDMKQNFPGFANKCGCLGRREESRFDRNVRDLIQKMISKVPDERPSCEEILNSPLFSQV